MKWRRWVFLPAFWTMVNVIVLLASPGVAQAVMLELSLEQLASGADTIVVGTVVERTSQWNAEHTRIYTSVVLSVEETIKGVPQPNRITIIVPGGEVGGITEWVSDAARFAPGEKAVVFLKQFPDARFEVYGHFQGKFTVEQGQVAGVSLVEFKEKLSRAIKGLPGAPRREIRQPDGPVFFDAKQTGPPATPQSAPVRTPGWQTILSEGFEGAFPGVWTVAGNPTWGKTTYNVYAGSYCGWCARSGTLGTDPAANPTTFTYANNMNAWMVYGPFSLSDASAAELSYYRWRKTEPDADIFKVYMSTDGAYFWGWGYSGVGDSWANVTLDLRTWYHYGNLCGQSQVWLAFAFTSNASVTDKGVFLDNITLRKYVGAVPQISGISPAQASAGTNSMVTISGSGFGTTPGSVNFFYRSGQPTISGSVTSWSDTSIQVIVPTAIINDYPASASSGPVVVSSEGAASVPYPFTVTFSYSGRKWAGTSPVVNYRINPNTADCSVEEIAVQNAAATWNAVPNKNFTLNYAGSTTATAAGYNGVNEIMWRDLGSTGPLAVASGWSSGGNILETDIEFNEYWIWSTATTPPAGTYDVQTTALHELGHWLNLRDLYGNVSGYPQDTAKVMYGIGSSGATKRTLHADDEAGIRWIYPMPLSVTFDGWYVDGNKVDTTTKGKTVMAKISLSGGDSGQYSMRIRRDIQLLPDDTVTNLAFTYDGTSTTKELSFSPPYAAGESSTQGYHTDLQKDGSTVWTMPDAYPPRLTVNSAPIPVAPTVTTDKATIITTSSAVLNGTLTSKGTADNVTLSFQWGLSENYTNETTPISTNATGPFSFTLGSLSPSTIYHYRAKAVGDGISYGLDKTFTTETALVSINITPVNPTVLRGRPVQFTATGRYCDNSTANLTTVVTWASSNTAVATIAAGGLATGKAVGTTNITATMANISGSTTLTVTAPMLDAITVTPPNASIPAGRSQQFTATGVYSDNSTQNITNTVTWSSSNTTVASVSSSVAPGWAYGYNPGSAMIIASQGGISGMTTLTVTAAVLDAVSVFPGNPTIVLGRSLQFRAFGLYSDGSLFDITTTATWTSDTPTVASIGITGLATSVGAGTATISAALTGKVSSTTLRVTAASLVSIAVTPPSPAIPAGGNQLFTATGTYADTSTADLTYLVTWSSSNAVVARINALGTATSYAPGMTNITATSGAISGSTTLTVTAPVLVAVNVTPFNWTLLPPPPGLLALTILFVSGNPPRLQFTATGIYSDGATTLATTTATWTSSNPGVATIVANTGLATTVSPGVTTITATFGGRSGSVTLTVLPDTVAPVVRLNSPTEGLIVPNNTLTVSGNVDDPNAVTTVMVNGGAPVPLTLDGAGNFSQGVVLNAGSNTIVVRAVDPAGNTGTTGIIKVVVSPTRPSIAITQPANGLLTNNPSLSVSGNLTGATTATLRFNGIAQTIAVVGGGFSANVTLMEGTNILAVTAYATGHEGDLGYLGTSGTRTVILDTTPPLVTITSPVPGSIVSYPGIRVMGTVDDPGVGTMQLILNSGTPVSVTVVGGIFSQDITLVPGINTIVVSATDRVGNTSSPSPIAVTLDNTKPGVTIHPAAPANRLLTNVAAQMVWGGVNNPAITTATLYVNGVPQTIAVDPVGSFSRMVALSSGINTIEVRASDSAVPPNTGSSGVVTVIVDTTPPVLTLALSDPTDSITIIVSSDEPLASPPGVTVSGTNIALSWADVNRWVGTYGSAAAPIAASSYTVTVTGTDRAGNIATRTATFAKLRIDVDGVTPTSIATATTRLEVETRGTVSNAAISLTQHGGNPSGNVGNPVGAPISTGTFIEINGSPELANNLRQIYVRANYNPAELPPRTDESSLKLYLWDATQGVWQAVPASGVNLVEHYIYGVVTHLTQYGGFGAPVVVPLGATVNISVVLQGGSRPDAGWVIPVTVKFFSPGANVLSDSPLYTCNLTTTKSGATATATAGVLPGTYDITIVSEHTLVNVMRNVVVSALTPVVNMGTLLEGDANNDYVINISDFGILAVSFMKTTGQSGFDARADFDRNGIINISDFGLLAVNFLRTSPVTVANVEKKDTLTVHFIDVGQGDSILVGVGDTEILIDGGGRTPGVVNYINAYIGGALEVMVATHPHADHIGGLIAVLDRFEVKEIWLNGDTSTSETFSEFMNLVNAENAIVHEAERGKSIQVGVLTFVILHPIKPLNMDTNNNSIVLSLSYGDIDFLFMGDAERQAESSMLNLVSDIEILKVGHHGSRSSSSPEFLNLAKPEVAIYMAGQGNTYGHPHQETIDALNRVGAKIYGTDTSGTIRITTEGKTYSVQTTKL